MTTRLLTLFATACIAGAGLGTTVEEALARRQLEYASGTGELSVWGAVYARAIEADRAADDAWLACRTQADVEARAAKVRAAAAAAIGGFPERTPLNVQTMGRIARDGYAIEKILFESRPKHYVSAHVFLPASPEFKPPYPAMVITCGHSNGGKDCDPYQRGALQAAKTGIAALIYDPIDQGERAQLLSDRKMFNCAGHNHIGRKAALIGWNTAQFRIWDGMRAFDVLASRPDIDASRLGVMGHSGGGTLSSYLMAFEPRALCGAPSGYVSTLRDVLRDCGPQDAEQNFFGQLAYGFNHLGLFMLRAPKPSLLCCSYMDFFPYEGSMATYSRARTIFERIGAGDRLGLVNALGVHHWHESTRTATIDWLRRWLKGDESMPAAPDMEKYRPLDVGLSYKKVDVGLAGSPEATVTQTGNVMDIPGARSVYDIMRDELARLEKSRPALTRDVVLRATGIDAAAAGRAVSVSSEKAPGGATVRFAALVRNGGVAVPTVSFMPGDGTGAPVLIVGDWKDCKERSALAPRVEGLLAAGRPVMVAELRAFGETGRMKHAYYKEKDADEEVAVMYYMLGESLVRHRAEDLLAAAAEFSSLVGGAKTEIEAEGRAVVPAAHAYYLARDRFAAFKTPGRVPKSWTEAVANDAEQFRFACIVHGGLRFYDWTDLVK